jgi:hypothetical protein
MRALAPACPPKARVEDDDRETFRRSIDRGRETGGARADDGDVIGLIPLVGRHRSERTRQIGLALKIVPSDTPPAAGPRDLLDQLRRIRILCRVEQLMRVGIAGQEALRPD